MPTMLELYHNDMSVCAQKVRLVLAYKNLEWQGQNLDLRGGEQFKPEFRKINPKGVVPVLVHDNKVVTESNVIIEYIEEVFPEQALLSNDPYQRANVRAWLTRLDAGLHDEVAVISFCIAFRHQMLDRYPDSESLQGFFDNIADPSRKVKMEDMVLNGMDSPRLALAVYAYDKLIKDMARALESSDWLVGEAISLADLSFLPYIERLEQLQLMQWWADFPQIDQWLGRLRKTKAYDIGMREWHNPKYIGMMKSSGANAWEKISKLRAS